MDEKGRIREEIMQKLEHQSGYERLKRSELIKQKVFSTKEYQEAKLFFTYVSNGLEVDTWQIVKGSLKIKKKVCVPVITDYKKRKMEVAEVNDILKLRENKWGIYQPPEEKLVLVDKTSIDLILVPGIAFDIKGNRLGRGKGFFDEFLKDVINISVFGLAFSFQIFNSLPVTEFDIPVSKVITA